MTLKATEDKTPLLKQVDTSKIFGLDVGITNLLTTLNNQIIDNPRFLKRAIRNLRRK